MVLDRAALADEPLWKTEPVITLGKSVKLVLEVVRLFSPTFPELNLTAAQIFIAA